MVAKVCRSGSTIAVSVETSNRTVGEERKRLLEYCASTSVETWRSEAFWRYRSAVRTSFLPFGSLVPEETAMDAEGEESSLRPETTVSG